MTSPLAAALANAERVLLQESLEKLRAASEPPPTFEEFVCSSEWCNTANFEVSPTQRALIAASDGLAINLPPQQVEFHFGAKAFALDAPPTTVVIRSGVRSGKSLLSAERLLYGALYSDCSKLRPGELVRGLIVAPQVSLSAVTFRHLVGTLKSSPKLQNVLVKDGVESAVVRRGDGVEIELRIVAASAGGRALRSTWLVGAVFDEADFHDGEESAVNLPENYDAVLGRMLPGAQIWIPSSPWADTGPFHYLFTEHFGRPKNAVISFHSDSFSMNPGLDRSGEAQLRAREPDKAAREFDAIPISSSAAEFFPMDAVRLAVRNDRPIHLPPDDRTPHWGGSDLGFTKNSAAVAFACAQNGKVTLSYHDERRPQDNRALSPSDICATFASSAVAYNCSEIWGDNVYKEVAIHEFAKHKNVKGNPVRYEEWDSRETTAAFTEFRRLIVEGLVELPNAPALILQIEKTRTKPMPGGLLKVILPKIGHTHGDVLMAVVLACVKVPLRPTAPASAWGNYHVDSRWGGGNERGFG